MFSGFKGCSALCFFDDGCWKPQPWLSLAWPRTASLSPKSPPCTATAGACVQQGGILSEQLGRKGTSAEPNPLCSLSALIILTFVGKLTQMQGALQYGSGIAEEWPLTQVGVAGNHLTCRIVWMSVLLWLPSFGIFVFKVFTMEEFLLLFILLWVFFFWVT